MQLSSFFIPMIVLLILLYAIYKKVPVYDSFITGAKEGLVLSISVLPVYMAMIFGMNLLLKSGFITDSFKMLKPLLTVLHIPLEIIPLALTRPISGNASFVVMMDIIKTYGVDSTVARIAAMIQGATDTTIYVLSLYFGSIGIKNIRYALKAGLFADFVTVVMSILLVSIFFS